MSALGQLEVRDLEVSFDGFQVLQGVDLSVRPGEVRFVIGPNGAGKTTLVDCITGLSKPTGGTITFDGVELTGRREHQIVRLGVGRSFQAPTVFESLTVTENLDLSETFKKRMIGLFRRRRGRSVGVDEALERIGLTGSADALAGTLSHGQKQWLEIGMLLVQQPRLLLLDELVAGMTTEERQATGELLRDLAAEHTIVVIEHDMAFLRRFADAVTVLHEGKILAEGSVADVQADPAVREVYLGRSRDERSGGAVEDTPTTAPDGT